MKTPFYPTQVGWRIGRAWEPREVHPKPWRVPYAASRLKAAVS